MARFVLTTRLAGYSGPPVPGVREVELLPFTLDDANAAIRTWDLSVEAFARLTELLRDPAIGGMARIPLLLALICSLAADLPNQQQLPKTRTDLYDAVVWQFLSGAHRTADRGGSAPPTSPTERQSLLQILTQIAFNFATTDRGWIDRMPYSEVTESIRGAGDALADLGGSAAVVLGRLADEAGVLVPAGNPALRDQSYVFLHRTVAEYLVARYMRDLPQAQRMQIVRDHQWFDPDWAEVIPIFGGLLTAQDVGDTQTLVTHFLAPRTDPLHRAFHTALRVLGESPSPDHLLSSGQMRYLSNQTLGLIVRSYTRPALLRALAAALAGRSQSPTLSWTVSPIRG